jgi:iron complex transport system ATP-binding protein
MGPLVLQNVTAGYSDTPVLENLDLEVRPGEILALIGPNGVGKTTLLRVMGRLLRPLAGRVSLDGTDIWQMRPRQAAMRIARVPQFSQAAWPYTVRQAVQLGRFPQRGWLGAYRAADETIIAEALAATGLRELGDRPITELSGGEYQRVLIARALAQTPEVLLLDEPVAHLDLKYQVSILELVQGLARGGLAVAVSLHDLNHASFFADRLALFRPGGLEAIGSPTEIIQTDLLGRVYGTTVLVEKHGRTGTPMVLPWPMTSRK